MTAPRPKIYLTGGFRIETADGARVEITAAKSQGLLALLATAHKGERSRAWLQSKLWSDRAPEQASGSMRQALSQTRKVLRAAGIPLETSRQRIGLDLTQVDIVDDGPGEFLEGLDVRDQEFEAWLTVERQRRGGAPLAKPEQVQDDSNEVWAVRIVTETRERTSERWFETVFADALSRSLREIFSAPVSVGDEPEVSARMITIRVEGYPGEPGHMALRVRADHPAARHQVWSGHRAVRYQGAPNLEDPELLRLTNELVEAVGDYLIQVGRGIAPSNDPDRICRQALRSLFSMCPDRLQLADEQFQRAFEMQPRGLYLAWRAQLRAIQSVERHPADPDTLAEEGRYFCARALEMEPGNSMVVATLSNALRRFDRDDQRSLALARRGVQLNPANPMAWWALCAAHSYVGEDKASLRAGVLARQLAILSPHRFWWDNQRFVPSLLEGDFKRALELAEQAHAGNPNFRPPLRHLVALYAHAGRYADAQRAVEKLKTLEPDFEVERLIHDGEYPASILRRVPKLDTGRILSVG